MPKADTKRKLHKYDTFQTPQGVRKDPGTGGKSANSKQIRYYNNTIFIPEGLGFDQKQFYDDSTVVDIQRGFSLIPVHNQLERVTD